MTKGTFAACAALLGIVPAAAWADDAMVHVGHNQLAPAEVTISVGDKVTFHNMAAMPGGHTVVADDGSVSSPPLAENEAWTHTFEEAGRFGFHIEQHPDARCEVVVE